MKKIVNILIIIVFVLMACNQKIHPQGSRKNEEMATEEIAVKKPQPLTDNQYRKLNAKLLSGVDFVATGNEPFWSLEIDFDKHINFTTVRGDSISTPAVKGIRLADAAATSYTTRTGAGLLNIIIYDQACVNDMSGDTLPKMAQVYVDDTRYFGCGRYLADYRLHDIWVLKAINDTAVNGKELLKGLPLLEINLNTNKVFGTAGCNDINGDTEVKGKYIYFSRIISTRMACNDGGFESRYLAALSSKDMRYTVSNGLLTIQAGNSVFTYRKVD